MELNLPVFTCDGATVAIHVLAELGRALLMTVLSGPPNGRSNKIDFGQSRNVQCNRGCI